MLLNGTTYPDNLWGWPDDRYEAALRDLQEQFRREFSFSKDSHDWFMHLKKVLQNKGMGPWKMPHTLTGLRVKADFIKKDTFWGGKIRRNQGPPASKIYGPAGDSVTIGWGIKDFNMMANGLYLEEVMHPMILTAGRFHPLLQKDLPVGSGMGSAIPFIHFLTGKYHRKLKGEWWKYGFGNSLNGMLYRLKEDYPAQNLLAALCYLSEIKEVKEWALDLAPEVIEESMEVVHYLRSSVK